VTPSSHHGRFENPKKSAYAFEKFDFDWERQYMQGLEADALVDAWTKNHGIRIPYVDHQNRKREFRPDFLVRSGSGSIEVREVKGAHLIDNPDTKRKFEAAKRWCAERNAAFVVVTKEG
jgi:hypothetical protein